MITAARQRGYYVAADNLEYWLNGAGGVRRIDVGWLRSNSAVTDAERHNQRQFEKQLKARAGRMPDNATETLTDHWDRAFTARVTSELYYASGTSELSSRATFTLSRMGRTVTVRGSVQHYWHDPYNWNPGQAAYIPGFGLISDNDALALRRAGIGRDYELVSDWTQTCAGSVDLGRVYDTIDLNWTGP